MTDQTCKCGAPLWNFVLSDYLTIGTVACGRCGEISTAPGPVNALLTKIIDIILRSEGS